MKVRIKEWVPKVGTDDGNFQPEVTIEAPYVGIAYEPERNGNPAHVCVLSGTSKTWGSGRQYFRAYRISILIDEG